MPLAINTYDTARSAGHDDPGRITGNERERSRRRVRAAGLRGARARGETVARSLDDDSTRTRLRGIRSGT